MILKINKELFQWEKNRKVEIICEDNESKPTSIQFYNKKSSYGSEVSIVDNYAVIPNYLLKQSLPIVAVACLNSESENLVLTRRVFKVLARVKPEFYQDEEDTSKDIIYDGGEEI